MNWKLIAGCWTAELAGGLIQVTVLRPVFEFNTAWRIRVNGVMLDEKAETADQCKILARNYLRLRVAEANRELWRPR